VFLLVFVCLLVDVDDLAKLLESYGVIVRLFADDVKVCLQIADSDDVAKLQYALDLITQWAAEWQFSLSVAKCNTLSIGKTPIDAQFHIHDTELPQLSHCADLGVVITCDLFCSLHIWQICVKAHQRANSICVVFCLGMFVHLLFMSDLC